MFIELTYIGQLSGGVIGGIVVGILAFLTLIVIGFLLILRQRRKRRESNEPQLSGKTNSVAAEMLPKINEKEVVGTALTNSGKVEIGGRLGTSQYSPTTWRLEELS